MSNFADGSVTARSDLVFAPTAAVINKNTTTLPSRTYVTHTGATVLAVCVAEGESKGNATFNVTPIIRGGGGGFYFDASTITISALGICIEDLAARNTKLLMQKERKIESLHEHVDHFSTAPRDIQATLADTNVLIASPSFELDVQRSKAGEGEGLRRELGEANRENEALKRILGE
ncbi:hypothetical protein MKZ38_001318 [Zalerion maritima]|uniref:Uncharacterized protein n=1 Tax=Zalerion maritima TaxID=339359 RepID=A0AAD5WS02_9PEZI|nr:hypothetical protein MKZ38_001318 [Zalerion maritima]